MKKTKIIVFVALMLVMSTMMSFNVFAAESNDNLIMPLWESLSCVELDMTFVDGNGNAVGIARRQASATGIEGTLYLYKEVDGEWVYIDENYVGFPRGSLAVGIDFPCESGVTYKAVFVVTAYTGSAAETETFECIDTCK